MVSGVQIAVGIGITGVGYAVICAPYLVRTSLLKWQVSLKTIQKMKFDLRAKERENESLARQITLISRENEFLEELNQEIAQPQGRVKNIDDYFEGITLLRDDPMARVPERENRFIPDER